MYYLFILKMYFFVTILPALIAAMAYEPKAAVSSHWYTDRKFTISRTFILVILPLSVPKEIGFQKYASTLSVIGTWYVTVVIIKYLWPDPEISAGDIPSSRSPPGGAVLHRRESASKSAQRSLSMQCCDQQENI
ncbi:sodium-coupled neutral amino acid transporter 7-like isoform X1 [Latimeria chalumnae]|uniref:sodium-coupled neutral amino acid transporter 7-like isoform X1 n=1 Tax=Latimeria chalumnae TaxID=7897 RepID=UPI00313EBE13